jgi:hypothetical protein
MRRPEQKALPMRTPRSIRKGRREFHLALLEQQLGGFRDLAVALAKKYPGREAQFAEIVEDALRHLRNGLRILERHRRC